MKIRYGATFLGTAFAVLGISFTSSGSIAPNVGGLLGGGVCDCNSVNSPLVVRCPPAVAGVLCPTFIPRCARHNDDGNCKLHPNQTCGQNTPPPGCLPAEAQTCTYDPACSPGGGGPADHADMNGDGFVIVGSNDWVPVSE